MLKQDIATWQYPAITFALPVMSLASGLGKVYIDATRCFGCGVCRAACTTDAITLIPRQEIPETADLWLQY